MVGYYLVNRKMIFMQESEFGMSVKTDGLLLTTPSQVLVVCEWEWVEDGVSEESSDRTHVSEYSLEGDHYYPFLASDSSVSDDDDQPAHVQ